MHRHTQHIHAHTLIHAHTHTQKIKKIDWDNILIISLNITSKWIPMSVSRSIGWSGCLSVGLSDCWKWNCLLSVCLSVNWLVESLLFGLLSFLLTTLTCSHRSTCLKITQIFKYTHKNASHDWDDVCKQTIKQRQQYWWHTQTWRKLG